MHLQQRQSLLAFLKQSLETHGDPLRASEMAAYMKHIQPFYGVPSNSRRHIIREGLKLFPMSSPEEYRDTVMKLWNGHYREERYLALEIVERATAFRNIHSWPLYVEIMHSCDWWDTLDFVAARIISPLICQHCEYEKKTVEWRLSAHLWTRRAALLAHLKHKSVTNTALLAETILILASDNAFFIRKAIGWVLREYSKIDSEWVDGFVALHTEVLSNLSRREALKIIQKRRRDDGR